MQLLRVEALARSGATSFARELVRGLAMRVRALGAVDAEILDSLEAALKGDIPDVDLLEVLRTRAEEQISERLRRAG